MRNLCAKALCFAIVVAIMSSHTSAQSAPIVNTVSPTTGVAGTQVTFSGSGFGATQGTGNVWLGSTYGTVVSWSDTQVVATVASGAKSGTAQILQGGVWSDPINFTVVTPVVSSVTPANGGAGAQVTFTGTGFGAIQGAGNVWLGSTYGGVVSWSDTQVVATVASGAKSGTAQILQGGVWSDPINFTVTTPKVTSVTPTSGMAGTQVTFTGSGFGATQGTGNVWLGSTYGVVVSWSDTQVVATVASGAKSGTAQILQGGVWSDPIDFAIQAPAAFVLTSSLNTARDLQTATLLTNGTVLFVGGRNFGALASAELYNPTAGSVTVTGSLNSARYSHTATLLSNGEVLIVGGSNSTTNSLASAELYHPVTGTFMTVSNLNTGRYGHTATLLGNGKVLIVGGSGQGAFALSSAELYDPINASFTPAGNLAAARAFHTATLLNDGSVLIAGGYDNNFNNLASAELYNPTTGTFTAVGNLNAPRNSHTATLLNSGKVLIAEGFDNSFNVLASAELYDPTTSAFTYTGNPNVPRDGYTATLLNNGTVLFAAGYDANFIDIASAELYDPATGTFTATASANFARDSHTATLLNDGTVLVAGGIDNSGSVLQAVELYQPGSQMPPGLVSIEINPLNPSMGVATGQRFTATGTFADGSTRTLASVTWNSSDNTLATITNDVSNHGNVFALAAGSVTINGCAGAICGSTSLAITPSPLVSIMITPANPTILIGSSLQFYATGTFADGGTEDLSASVTWSSSSSAVAAINSTGSVNTFSKGVTAITASLGSVTASTNLTATPELASIAVAPQTAFVGQGSTQQFSAIGTYTDGSTADLTNAVVWTSSIGTVATINSAGLAMAASPGTTTITATSGEFTSSATLKVTVALASIAINPSNPSLPIGLTEPLQVIGTFADGTTQDLTSAVTWSSSTPAVATVSSAGMVNSVTQGVTTITANYGSITASASLTVAPPVLLNAALNPQSPVLSSGATQQFSATGRYSDGVIRDITSLLTWSSSDPSIATIGSTGLASAGNAGQTTITASLSPLVFSTNLTVTSAGPPAITAVISPAPNAAGWNNSNVTVTFTCTPGSAIITSCPAAQIVTSEGVNQIVTGTVTDAAGNSATTSVSLNIDKTPPTLTVSSPIDGSIFATAELSVTGTISDALSGVSSLTCNGAPVTLSGGSFSCNISLNPGVNLVVARATDLAGNVALVKMHVNCTLPLPAPNSLQITPSNANLLVGETHQFTAVDEHGRPRTDASWTVSNTAVATITADSSPLLSALQVGQVTLTATAQGVSTHITVKVLSAALGSGNWSLSSLPGFFTEGMQHAVPSDAGVDIYSYDRNSNNSSDRVLRAFAEDGRQIWQQSLGYGFPGIPDMSAGVVVFKPVGSGGSLVDLDAQTGSTVWQYDSQNGLDNFAIRPDGAIVAIESEPQARSPLEIPYIPRQYLDIFDGNTGQLTLHLPLQQSVDQHHELVVGCQPWDFVVLEAGSTSAPAIDSDGSIYLEYSVVNSTHTAAADCTGPMTSTFVYDTSTILLTVLPDGSISTQTLKSETATTLVAGPQGGSPGDVQVLEPQPPSVEFDSGSFTLSGRVIPDGQGGVLAAWRDTPNPIPPIQAARPVMVTHLSPSGGSTYSLPIVDVYQFVLGEGTIAFATDVKPFGDYAQRLVSFDVNSGQVFWSYEPPVTTYVSLVAAADGGTLAATIGTDSEFIRLNDQGVPETIASLPGQTPPIYSWSQQWHVMSSSGVAAINVPVAVSQDSLWTTPAGNASSSQFAAPLCPCLWQSTDDTAAATPTVTSATVASSNGTMTPEPALADPLNCPICNLQPPLCLTMDGTQSTFIIIVGDQGLKKHDLGDILKLSAQTKANELSAQGHRVVACRASSIQDFDNALLNHGFIDGGVIYFGHGGAYELTLDSGQKVLFTILAVGQQAGAGTNIDTFNVFQLANVRTAYIGPDGKAQNIIGPNAALQIDACSAGATINDFNVGQTSIAQRISDQIQRGVYAWKVGIYFSQQDAAHDKHFNGMDTVMVNGQPQQVPRKLPRSLPMYPVPEGPPGQKPAATPFTPQ